MRGAGESRVPGDRRRGLLRIPTRLVELGRVVERSSPPPRLRLKRAFRRDTTHDRTSLASGLACIWGKIGDDPSRLGDLHVMGSAWEAENRP